MKDITTERTGCFVLVGDLAGFSSAYASGNSAVVEEFIRRFYIACSVVISAAEGELVKYTGDGFLSIWSLKEDFRENSQTALAVEAATIALSVFVKFAELDLRLGFPVYLRQGITVEPNALRVSFQRRGGVYERDYIGKMVNLAFRIPSLTKSFPYVAAHKHFVEIAAMYGSSYLVETYRARTVTEEEVKTIFNGVVHDTDAVLTNEYEADYIEDVWGQDGSRIPRTVPVMMAEPLDEPGSEPGVLAFQNRLGDSCESGASWLQNTYWFYIRFVSALYVKGVELEREAKRLEDKLLRLKAQRGESATGP
jgi:hypothetical protein